MSERAKSSKSKGENPHNDNRGSQGRDKNTLMRANLSMDVMEQASTECDREHPKSDLSRNPCRTENNFVLLADVHKIVKMSM